MKLELKQITHYLPYGLNFICFDVESKEFEELPLLSINLRNDELEIGGMDIPIDELPYPIGLEVKPILRPLSDLTKEIKVNGEKFVPIVELLKLAHETYYNEKIGSRYQEIEFKQTPIKAKACFSFMATKDLELYTLMPWNFPTWITQKLFEWHFDVFGLIPQGLAIDFNTLEK